MRRFTFVEACIVIFVCLIIVFVVVPHFLKVEVKHLPEKLGTASFQMTSKIVSITYNPNFLGIIILCEDGSTWVRYSIEGNFINTDSNNFIERK